MKQRMIAAGLLALGLLALLCSASGEATLPKEIQAYFSAEPFADAVISDQASLSDHGGENVWFVLLCKGKTDYVLYGFKQRNDEWQYWMHTDKAVLQGTNQVHMTLHAVNTIVDDHTGSLIDDPLLFIYRLDSENEYAETSVFYAYQDSCWRLTAMKSYRTNDIPELSIKLGDGWIAYYQDIESPYIAGTAYGAVQRDIRYVDLSAIPKTFADAQVQLTAAPSLTASNQLTAMEIPFTAGKRYAVYTAPDSVSLRGGNGKAMVSTNGRIQAFGEENGWILIHYSIDKEHYRFGYIFGEDLPEAAKKKALTWLNQSTYLLQNAAVTDDPFYSQRELLVLQKGLMVTLLATVDEWAYIESNNGHRARGFVKLDALTCDQPKP